MRQLSEMMSQVVSIVRTQKNPNFIIFGEQLLSFGTFYKLYGTYFGSRLRSEKFLKTLLEEEPEKMHQVDEHLKDEAKRIDPRKENITIGDCLQQPQYRMFKYVLLLRDYLKKLPKVHKDYEPLQRAFTMFEEINTANN